MKVANLVPKCATRAGLRHTNPDWETIAWRNREESVERQISPNGWFCRPTLKFFLKFYSTGGPRYLPFNPDGSFPGQGYAPTKHTVKTVGHNNDLQISALFRLNCLTDPNPALQRRADLQGTCRSTEFKL